MSGQGVDWEKASYGKAVSSQYFRAHQQRSDLMVVAPGRQRMEFLATYGAGTEKWQADRDPLAIFVQEGKRYLIAPYGIVNWVRNLRAARGEATLTCGRRTEKIHAIELEPEAAAPIFRESVRSGPPGIPTAIFRAYRSLFVLPYLKVTENSSLEEYEREVLTHPVFLLQSEK